MKKGKAILTICAIGGAIFAYARYGEALNLPSFQDIGATLKEKWKVVSEMEQPNYTLEAGGSFSSKYDVLEGDVAYSEIELPDGFAAQGIQKLEVDAAGCVVKFVPSPDDAFHMEASGCRKLQYYVEKATLYLVSTGGITSGSGITDGVKNTVVTVYCPANTLQISIGAKLGAGSIEFGDISAQEVSLKCGAGKISAGNLDADHLKVDVDAGAVELESVIADQMEMEAGMGAIQVKELEFREGSVVCSMGNVDLSLKGEEKDYNITLKAAAGMVTVGDQQFKGLTNEKKLENKADRALKIECSMGNVTIRFR